MSSNKILLTYENQISLDDFKEIQAGNYFHECVYFETEGLYELIIYKRRKMSMSAINKLEKLNNYTSFVIDPLLEDFIDKNIKFFKGSLNWCLQIRAKNNDMYGEDFVDVSRIDDQADTDSDQSEVVKLNDDFEKQLNVIYLKIVDELDDIKETRKTQDVLDSEKIEKLKEKINRNQQIIESLSHLPILSLKKLQTLERRLILSAEPNEFSMLSKTACNSFVYTIPISCLAMYLIMKCSNTKQ